MDTQVSYVACDAFMGGMLGPDWALGQVTPTLAVRFPLDLPVPCWPAAVEAGIELATGDGELVGEVDDQDLEEWMRGARASVSTYSGCTALGLLPGTAYAMDVGMLAQGLRIVRGATPAGPWLLRYLPFVGERPTGRCGVAGPTYVAGLGVAIALDRSDWRLLAACRSCVIGRRAPKLRVVCV